MQNVSEKIVLIFFAIFGFSGIDCDRGETSQNKKIHQTRMFYTWLDAESFVLSEKKMFQGMKINFRLFRGFLVPIKGVRGSPK